MEQQATAIYTGPIKKLQNKRALIRIDSESPSIVLAQFNDRDLTHDGVRLGFNWHIFGSGDFVNKTLLTGDTK